MGACELPLHACALSIAVRARAVSAGETRLRRTFEASGSPGDLFDIRVSEFYKYRTMARSQKPLLSASQFQAVAKALADPRRMTLLESIASESEYSCQKLCQQSGVSKGTVSHHVKELVRAGLIAERRCGQYMFYEVRREVLAAYTAELMRRVAGAVPV